LSGASALSDTGPVQRVGDVLAIQEPDFAAELCSEPPAVTLRGSADIGKANLLGTWFGQVHEALVSAGADSVQVDLRKLEFMSASAFNELLSWLGMITELPELRRYKLRLLSNPEIHWQRRSLKTLACFSVDLISVEAT
jgi:hypothetical protein